MFGLRWSKSIKAVVYHVCGHKRSGSMKENEHGGNRTSLQTVGCLRTRWEHKVFPSSPKAGKWLAADYFVEVNKRYSNVTVPGRWGGLHEHVANYFWRFEDCEETQKMMRWCIAGRQWWWSDEKREANGQLSSRLPGKWRPSCGKLLILVGHAVGCKSH